jgi:Ala-tRNA(Pro) deacylase
MPVQKLRSYLDSEGVKYVTVTHSVAYTAQEIAARAHVRGKQLAKTVMVKLDGVLAMAVLPANYKVDFDLLREASGAKEAELATEREFKDKFPDCDVGAMPPFGNVYGIDVYVAKTLEEDDEIAFNACSHTELIKMPYADFKRLAKPKVVRISLRH